MGKFDTHGGYFAPQDYFRINTGGSHDENPNGGVQVGVDQNGIPNLLEEGEPVYNDYVYSDNIKAKGGILEKHNLPKKYENMLYSEIADKYIETAEQRPLSAIERNTLRVMLSRLAEAQEEQKQKSEVTKLKRKLNQMPAEELMQLNEAISRPQGMPMTQSMMRDGGFIRKYQSGGIRSVDSDGSEMIAVRDNTGRVGTLGTGYTNRELPEGFTPGRFDDGPTGMIPVAGDILSAAQAVKDVKEGDYLSAAMFPIALIAGGAASKTAKKFVANNANTLLKGFRKESKRVVDIEKKTQKAATALADAKTGVTNANQSLSLAKASKVEYEKYQEGLMERLRQFAEDEARGKYTEKEAKAIEEQLISAYNRNAARIKQAASQIQTSESAVKMSEKSVSSAENTVTKLSKGSDTSDAMQKALGTPETPKAAPVQETPAPIVADADAAYDAAYAGAEKEATKTTTKEKGKFWPAFGKGALGVGRFMFDPTYAVGAAAKAYKAGEVGKGIALTAAAPLHIATVLDNYGRPIEAAVEGDNASGAPVVNWLTTRVTDRTREADGGTNDAMFTDLPVSARPYACGGRVNRYDDGSKLKVPMYSTLPRYAGIGMNALSALHNLAEKPDHYTYDTVQAYTPEGNMPLRMQSYVPIDLSLPVTSVRQQGNATARAINDAGAGPSTGSLLLANGFNAANASGNAFGQGMLQNAQQRNTTLAANNQAIAQQSSLEAQLSAQRAAALNRIAEYNRRNALQIAMMNNQAEQAKATAVGTALNDLAAGLAGIGTENFRFNNINSNPQYYLAIKPNGETEYVANIGKCGGLLKTYKK